MQEGDGSTFVPIWRLLVEGSQMVDDGRDKHVEYFAAVLAPGSEPEPLRFRFNDLVRLHQDLEQLTELQRVTLPALPAKVTWWSMLRGGHSHGFQHRRSDQIHEFLARLCDTLRQAYGGTDQYVDHCKPFSLLIRRGKVAARLQDERLLEQTLEEQERQAMEEFQTLLYDPDLLGDALEEAEQHFDEYPDMPSGETEGEAWCDGWDSDDGEPPANDPSPEATLPPHWCDPPDRLSQSGLCSSGLGSLSGYQEAAAAKAAAATWHLGGGKRPATPGENAETETPGDKGWNIVRKSIKPTKVRISALHHGQRDAAVSDQHVVEWIVQVSGHDMGEESVSDWLRSGVVLCDLANAIKPGSVKKVSTGASLFKHIENITKFIDASLELGVPRADAFSASDLQQGKNIEAVLEFLILLGGVVQVSCPSFAGPQLGNPVQPDMLGGAPNRRSQAGAPNRRSQA